MTDTRTDTRQHSMAEPSIDEGGDWDGADDPAELAELAAQKRAEAVSLLEALEARGEVAALDHPAVRVAPFFIGGAILLAGANIGYMRQMHEYEMEEGAAEHAKSDGRGRRGGGGGGGGGASKWGNKRQRQRARPQPTSASASASAPPSLSSNYGDKVKIDANWSPHRVALRALGIGTALAVGTFAVGTAATFWYLEVDSAQGFTDKMNKIIPPKFQAIQGVVRPPLEKIKELFQGRAAESGSDAEA